jgi:hypothetical protein
VHPLSYLEISWHKAIERVKRNFIYKENVPSKEIFCTLRDIFAVLRSCQSL